MLAGGVLEADMPSLKHYSIYTILICLSIGLSSPAGADCWRWVKTEWPSAIQDSMTGMAMTFDEARGLPAIFYQVRGEGWLRLWHYKCGAWTKTWEGWIVPPAGEYSGTIGMYFDRTRNSLVLIGGISYGFELVATGAFEFIEGEGWRYITEMWGVGGLGLTYDTDRKRAVVMNSGTIHQDGALEFDGTQFHVFTDVGWPYDFEGEGIGYDPEIRRVVCRGYYYGNYPFRVKYLEWDGASWIEVVPPHEPPGLWYFIYGQMPYVPALGALVVMTKDVPPQPPYSWQIWMYKDHDWARLRMEKENADIEAGAMTYDPARGVVVIFDGMKLETWEIRHSYHCRPLEKP